jgi:magnesium transporter
MNFDYMPELHWHYGYLWALSLMVLIAAALYAIFKSRDWL